MAFDGRANIIEIDDENKVVAFDLYRRKKISGTKLGPILGLSDLSSPFKVALELAGIYPGDKANKYINAGNILEPVIRNYVRKNSSSLTSDLGLSDDTGIIIEEPVDKDKCGYDHFHDNKMFGGLVDGYVAYGGKRQAILEIKTSHDQDKWLDSDGKVTVIPQTYMMQAGLYAELSGLDRIVFAVGFLKDEDYEHPELWTPSADNTALVTVEKPDMSEPMEKAEKWYHEYIDAGETPEWSEKDEELVKWLKSYDPNAKKNNSHAKVKRWF